MILTPSSFTLEHLTSLKFKELQKLSSQYQVNKRWAKKQELIDNLLALKDKNDEENQWRDGSVVLNDLKPNNESEVNKRLTFNIKKESQMTFDVPQNGKNLLDDINPRETYDVPPDMSLLGVEPITDSRATFNIPSKEKLIDIDPRATFDVPQTDNLLKDEGTTTKNVRKNTKNVKVDYDTKEEKSDYSSLTKGLKNVTFDISIKRAEEKNDKRKSEIKTLTIPSVKVPRRTRKDGENSKNDTSPIKMSSRSINIKRSTRLPVSKNNLIRSPATSVKKSVNKQSIKSLTIPQDMNFGQRQMSSNRFDHIEGLSKLVNKTKNTDENNKENMKTILRKRNSKPENVLAEKSTSKVNFATPPRSAIKTSKVLPIKKTPLKKENEKKSSEKRSSTNSTQTPGTKISALKKPITATKMPDFNKIHQKQFEQMDSLHDYIKKKEERIRKLFGTPQSGRNLQALNKSTPVFQLKTFEREKGIPGSEIKNSLTFSKKKENILAQKETLKSKLPPSKLWTDVKDRNRSHIHGVRTNKRFELQMKFRNM